MKLSDYLNISELDAVIGALSKDEQVVLCQLLDRLGDQISGMFDGNPIGAFIEGFASYALACKLSPTRRNIALTYSSN